MNNRYLYLFAILSSIALSYWIDYSQTLNPDGICYLMTAQAFADHTLSQTMQVCPQAGWPFFSWLIYQLHQITSLSYQTAGYLIDGVFSLSTVVLFIMIVKAMGGTGRVLWLAAGVILLSHEFNSARQYIVRDHGFWMCYLASVLLLINYMRKPSWRLAIAWNMSLLVATLFRIEGAIFMFGMPALTLCNWRAPFMHRIKNFFALNFVNILICISIIAFMLLNPEYSQAKLGRVAELSDQFSNGITRIAERFNITVHLMRENVLPIESRNNAGQLLFFLIISMYLINAIRDLSLGYFILLVYGFIKRASTLSKEVALVLSGYIGINFIITIGFVFQHLFISKRYLVALSLILMLWVPFAIDYFIRHFNTIRYRTASYLVAILIFISAIGGIVEFGYSKAYLPNAGEWIAMNVPADALLYANDYQLMYFSKHFGNDLFKQYKHNQRLEAVLRDGQWKNYNYLAIRLTKHHEQGEYDVLNEINVTPIKTFENPRGDKVLIYKITR